MESEKKKKQVFSTTGRDIMSSPYLFTKNFVKLAVRNQVINDLDFAVDGVDMYKLEAMLSNVYEDCSEPQKRLIKNHLAEALKITAESAMDAKRKDIDPVLWQGLLESALSAVLNPKYSKTSKEMRASVAALAGRNQALLNKETWKKIDLALHHVGSMACPSVRRGIEKDRPRALLKAIDRLFDDHPIELVTPTHQLLCALAMKN